MLYRILEEVQGYEATEAIKNHMFKSRKKVDSIKGQEHLPY
jgi:hypothetical protein